MFTRVHEHNTSFLVLTFLPYHTTPLFLNLMTLLPEDLTSTLKCLYPYKRSLTLPPRRAIVHSATTNKHFFAALNQYVLQVAKSRCEYQGLVSFWAGVTTEAVAGMLDSAKAGKLEIERRNTEDVLLRILPILNEAFALKEAPQLVVGSFMICVVLANKGSLSEVALDSLMEAVVGAWNEDITVSGFTCLSVLAQRKKNPLPRKVTKAISQVQNCADILKEISEQYSVASLVLQLVRGCASEIKKGRLAPSLTVVDQIVQGGFLDDHTSITVLKVFLQAVSEAFRGKASMGETSQQELSDTITKFNESDKLGPLLQKSIRESGIDLAALEMSLQAVIATGSPGPAPVGDIVMMDTETAAPAEDIFFQSLESLRDQTMTEVSFLLHEPPSAFEPLARAFIQAGRDKEKLSLFSDLKILGREKALEEPRYISFFVRFFSGPYSPTSRAQAIQTLATFLKSLKQKNLDLQALLPYTIAALMDPSVRVRNEATVLLAEIGRKCEKIKADDQEEGPIWGHNKLYGRHKQPSDVTWLQARQTHKIVHRILVPALEEYTLDPGHVRAVLVNAIRGPRESEGDTSKSTDTGLKKSARHDLFTFLCSHVVNSPLYSVRLRLLLILNEVGKVGSMTRTQALLPLFQQWQQLSPEVVKTVSDAENLSLKEVEERMFSIVSPRDPNAADILLSSVLGRQDSARETLVDATFDRLNRIWPALKEQQEVTAAELLLEVALKASESVDILATHARGLLRSVELSGPVLVSLLNKALGSTAGLDAEGPARKKRRTSANKTVLLNDSDPQAMERSIKRVAYILELIDGSKPENHAELAKGLVQVLGAVQQLKLRSHSEMSYILNLNLGILLAIVNAAKVINPKTPRFTSTVLNVVQNSPAKNIDVSAIRTDLIIDCVRTSESPAVQNTALLLVAGLSVLVPELVLHNIMPIFTFMGASVLRKDDAYSSHVVDQVLPLRSAVSPRLTYHYLRFL
jgi:U3 small nucleolar RNA-associated protein 10